MNKEWLYNQYITLNKSIKDISLECGWSTTYIHEYLVEYGIKKNRDKIRERRKQNVENYFLKKYGVKSSNQLLSVKKKKAEALEIDYSKLEKIGYEEVI